LAGMEEKSMDLLDAAQAKLEKAKMELEKMGN
jgi:hypothetical protein